MGYETTMYVVEMYSSTSTTRTGRELAMVELGKCGDGPVGRLISSKTRKFNKDEVAPFALWARNPDRQQEAVDFLRSVASGLPKDTVEFLQSSDSAIRKSAVAQGYTEVSLRKLAANIEDGVVSRDPYRDLFGVMELDEMIEALDAETNQWAMFICASALLKSMKEVLPSCHIKERLKVVTRGH